MNKTLAYLLVAWTVCSVVARPGSKPPFKLVKTIPLPGMAGRFDHFTIDRQNGRLFLPAEDRQTLEIVDLRTGNILHSIPGFEKPHAVHYRADTGEIGVSDDNGTLRVFGADSGDLRKALALTLNYCDGVRFDPGTKLLYVVNAHKAVPGVVSVFSDLAVVDTTRWEHVGDIQFAGDKVEEVALDESGARLFVAVAGMHAISVIDSKKRIQTAIWPIPVDGTPYSLVLDAPHHRLFVALRTPGTLLVLDSDTGKKVASVPSVEGIDDIYYDGPHRRVYVSAGVGSNPEGFIGAFQQSDADHYESLGTVSTGAASATSLFIPEENRYYVCVQRHGDKDAEIQIYEVQP